LTINAVGRQLLAPTSTPYAARRTHSWWAIPKKWRKKSGATGEALGGISRITFQMDVADSSQAKLMRSIKLLGTVVAPASH